MAFTKITNAGFGLTTGTLVGVAASFSSTVSVGGTLTYEDVTNVDSVGLITARNGIEVTDKGVQVGTGATVDSAAANTLTFLTGGSERVRVTSAGIVGINQSSPSSHAQLDIVGSSYWPILVKTTSANGGGVTIRDKDDVASLYVGSGGSSWLTGSSITDGLIRAQNNLLFATNGNNERLRINSGGQISIRGTNTAFDTTGDLDSLQLYYETDSGQASIGPYSSGGSTYLSFYTNSGGSAATEKLRITSAGDMGLGTNSPNTYSNYNTLTINGTSGGEIDFEANGTLVGDIFGNASGLFMQTRTEDPIVFSTYNGSNLLERLRITSDGNIGVGYASPSQKLVVKGTTSLMATNSTNVWMAYTYTDNTFRLNYNGAGSDEVTVDSAGKVGIGFAAEQATLEVQGQNIYTSAASSLATATTKATFRVKGATNSSDSLWMGVETTNAEPYIQGANGVGNNAKDILINPFGGDVGIGTVTPTDHNGFTKIIDVNGSGGGAVYCRTNGSSSNVAIFGQSGSDVYVINKASGNTRFNVADAEKMRLDNEGRLLVGKTAASANSNGAELRNGNVEYAATFSATSHPAMLVNRNTDDGVLVRFRGQGSDEGSISVSGSTVSYNGAHLARWSQLPGGAERTEILRGSVLSNLDEMCEWGDESNEQLNRMKVSDVEGDINVAGVFQDWDDDDDTYTNDFYCAMTGDFVIRIASGVTVQRGNLLMSAGDGTAKPQGDGYIQDKTIAKVTSTTVSTTYSDGSYCVPCVLMAC